MILLLKIVSSQNGAEAADLRPNNCPALASECDIYIEVSWFVQSQLIWSNYWIGLEKLPQNDSLNVEIRPLDQKLLICYIRSRKVIN